MQDQAPQGDTTLSLADASDVQAEAPTWEGDETVGTMALRSAATLVAGAFLAWTQYMAPIGPPFDWYRWIEVAVLNNFLLPLGLVWMFFGQGLRHCDWLEDQRHNAWNYGWDFSQWRRHGLIALVLFALMLAPTWVYAHQSATIATYTNYFPPVHGLKPALWFFGSIVVYMFCWEWFFRGFILFGTAQSFGAVAAILLQAALFGAAHWGKPMPEMLSSFAGGAILGVIVWREKSFLPAFLTHALIHLSLAAMVLMQINRGFS